MKKTNKKAKPIDDIREEYELNTLRSGVRGRYFERFRTGTNLVLLSPDVARHFPHEQSVNAALRSLTPSGKRRLRRDRKPELFS